MIRCPNCREDVRIPSRRDKMQTGKSVGIWRCPRCRNVLGGAIHSQR